MVAAQPHYLLFCEASFADRNRFDAEVLAQTHFGRWHFMLERLDGSEKLEATDTEACDTPERLALLSVVRGLEAIEQPSRVSLVTTSRYVTRGLRYGLNSWREHNYQWERFGEQKPVRNADLWQRVDRAMKFHGVQCRLLAPQSAQSAIQESVGEEIEEIIPELQENSKLLAIPAADYIVCQAPRAVAEKHAQNPIVAALTNTRKWTTETPAIRVERRHALTWEVDVAKWWRFVDAWMKWWRGRLQPRTAFYSA